MCRWNAYFGQPVLIDELLFKTKHSLIDQSLHSTMGVETTNGDGFGIGWYRPGDGVTPGRYRSVTPAWSDTNLREYRVADRIAPVPRPHPCHDGNSGAAEQLPPVPARALAVRAQRRHQRVQRDASRAAVRDRPGAVRRRHRVDRLRGALLPRAHVRARGGPARRRGAGRRLRGGRPAVRMGSRTPCR